MRAILVILALACLIFLLSGSAKPAPSRFRARVNADFFFANYPGEYDAMDAVKAYATALCVNARATGNSSQAWLEAGAKCYDTYSSDIDESSSNDGGWQDYQKAAYQEIAELCRAQYEAYEVCKYIK